MDELDKMVESLNGQVDDHGPLMQAVMKSPGDAKALVPVLFTVAKIVEKLTDQIGQLEARIQNLEQNR